MTITLPVPPSANRYWRNWNGRTVLSTEAREYKKSAHLRALAQGMRPVGGHVAMTVCWYRARKSGDLDNRLKVVIDSLKGVAYGDDAQIVRIYAQREDDKANPRMEITITEISA